MSAPEVSVVMSIHNGIADLERGVGCILAQNGVDLELIVVNDGSTDGSAERLDELAAADSRLRVLHQSNAGLTRALIRGCGAARGELIARQDCDDLSLPGRLAAQRDRLRAEPGLAFVSSWAEMVGPSGELLMVLERPEGAEEATHLLLEGRTGPPGHGSVMFRRSVYERVGGYRAAFYYAQDSDLWLRMGEVGQLGYVPRVLYRYAVSESSISGAQHFAKLAYAEMVDEARAARRAGLDDEEILARAPATVPRVGPPSPAAVQRALYFIGRCLYDRRDRRARHYLWRTVRLRPTDVRAWLVLGASLLLAHGDGARPA